jgi:hypothetical protein
MNPDLGVWLENNKNKHVEVQDGMLQEGRTTKQSEGRI